MDTTRKKEDIRVHRCTRRHEYERATPGYADERPRRGYSINLAEGSAEHACAKTRKRARNECHFDIEVFG